MTTMSKVYTPEEAIEFIQEQWKEFPTEDDSSNYTSLEGIRAQIEAMQTPVGKVFYAVTEPNFVRVLSINIVKEVVADFGITDRQQWLERNSDEPKWNDLFDHFMIAPVAIANGTTIAAISRTVEGRSELEKYIKEHKDAGETCYLYKILSLPTKKDPFSAPVSRFAVRYAVLSQQIDSSEKGV